MPQLDFPIGLCRGVYQTTSNMVFGSKLRALSALGVRCLCLLVRQDVGVTL